jgi:predicted Na+-dependent transporter
MACVIGSFQGMAVNAGMVVAKQLTGQPIPPAYVVPMVLSSMVAVMLGMSLGPAWNRRAERLLRRSARLERDE